MSLAVLLIIGVVAVAAVCAVIGYPSRRFLVSSDKKIDEKADDILCLSAIVRDLGKLAGRAPFDAEPEKGRLVELVESLCAFISLYKLAYDGSSSGAYESYSEAASKLYSAVCEACLGFLGDKPRRTRAETSGRLEILSGFVKSARSYATKITLAASLPKDGDDDKALLASINAFCEKNVRYSD